MTMTEFAEKIGVHYATVSRVFNDRPGVSEAKRTEILEAAERMGFHPNMAARELKMQKSFAVGMVTPSLMTSYWGTLFLEVQRALEEKNHGLLISPCTLEKGDTVRAIRFLLRQGISALILSTDSYRVQGEEEEIQRILKTAGIPVILLVTRWQSSKFSFVGNDVVADMQLATEHLLEAGHRNIAIMASENYNPGSANRIEGCRAALNAAGLAESALTILHGGYGLDDGKRAAEEWLASSKRPSAIIASTDMAHIGLFNELRTNNIEAPEDVTLFGYGGSPDLDVLRKEQDRIQHPFKAMANMAVEQLLSTNKRSKRAPKETLVAGEIHCAQR